MNVMLCYVMHSVQSNAQRPGTASVSKATKTLQTTTVNENKRQASNALPPGKPKVHDTLSEVYVGLL